MTIKLMIRKLMEKVAGNPVRGVANVMVYVAALDGKLLPEEIDAYRHLSGNQARRSSADIEADLKQALRGAGYLLALAVASSEEERISAFVEESLKALPVDFTQNLEDVRFAVLLWTAMAMADDDFAGIEMRAIDALKKRLAEDHLLVAEAATQSSRIFNSCASADVHASDYMKIAGENIKAFLLSDCRDEAKSMLS